jgi:hypothetical protein
LSLLSPGLGPATADAGVPTPAATDAQALPGAAEQVPGYAADVFDATLAPPTEPRPPGAVTERLTSVEDPAWRAWLLSLDEIRRTLAAHAEGRQAPTPATAGAAWDVVLDDGLALAESAPEGPGPAIDECGVVRVDGQGTDSTATCDYRLEVDVGGDDTYRNNAGGSLSPLADAPAAGAGLGPSALLVDLAGNDTHECQTERGGCNGGGYLAAGGLLDLAGSDTYEGEATFGSVNGGGGDWGLGLLYDAEGADRYDGNVAEGGINGGASFGGAGLLVDRAGDDTYDGRVERFGGVNGGANDGVGVHVDLGGADERDGYVGIRGGVNAGGEQAATLLVDAGTGDDRYDGSTGGGGVNAGGNGGGVGYNLVEEGGADTYHGTIRHMGSVNGASSYENEALLVDRAGDDTYEATIPGTGAANGAAHTGTGVLVDASGEDTYEATILDDPDRSHPLAGSGSASNGDETTGVGLLVDPDRGVEDPTGVPEGSP